MKSVSSTERGIAPLDDDSLEARHRKEQEFHDRMAENDSRWTTFRTWGLSDEAIRYAKDRLGCLHGKTIVDMGCGDGNHTLKLLSPKAKVLAFDLSRKMTELARLRLEPAAEQVGCSVDVRQMAAEKMVYPSDSADVIFGISILHHLDLSVGLQEVKRVLKPGGRGVFVEPLGRHPLAKAYRMLTPGRRSEAEKPLDYSVFKLLERHFPRVNHKEFDIVASAAAIFAFLRVRPLYNCSLRSLRLIDSALVRNFPSVRKFAWLTVIEVTK